VEIPQLDTPRLILRAHRLDDFPAFAAAWAEPDVVRYIGGKPSTERESWMRMLTFGGLWPALGYGYWAIEERSTGGYVGQVGLADFHREIEPAIAGVPEAGWVLAPAFHGKGYATEAMQAVLAWADARGLTERSVCIIDPTNAASVRVAEKCGYREFARTQFGDGDVVMLERVVSVVP